MLTVVPYPCSSVNVHDIVTITAIIIWRWRGLSLAMAEATTNTGHSPHHCKVTAKTIIKMATTINKQIMMRIFFCEQKKKKDNLKIVLQKNKKQTKQTAW